MINEVINALSYDVDFQRDIHEGDEIDVVFERLHTDKNVTAGYGKILYISLKLDDRELTLYRHISKEGFAGYYNAKGESVKKALLKTPINGAHITSSFGMRMHPLLGYTKMHKGIDFGALTGTPIYAAGDGIIEEAGRKGGYGNYVRVKHSSSYATAYAHTSRFAKGIKVGIKVKQGQVIAYVGSTGSSTGPHLHYEIIQNGSPVNPSGVKFRTGQTLAGRDMAEFKKILQKVKTALATLPRKNQVALARN
jgi:murein DD-endopeptidase MepM/ murein hydrolase activator NlpD